MSGKKKKKTFNLAKAVKKVSRENAMGLKLIEKDHGDKTKYSRNSGKKIKEPDE